MDALTLLVMVAMLATVGALVAGISAMTRDTEVGGRSSGQWMVMRVRFQAAAFLLLLLSLLLSR